MVKSWTHGRHKFSETEGTEMETRILAFVKDGFNSSGRSAASAGWSDGIAG